jgi:uncharacterized Fe-S center protein
MAEADAHAVPVGDEWRPVFQRELEWCAAHFLRHVMLTAHVGGRIKHGNSNSGGATLHTETAAHSSAFPHLIHELHANCPHCGRTIEIPEAAVHSDGTARGYCCTCRTEVFEASLEN